MIHLAEKEKRGIPRQELTGVCYHFLLQIIAAVFPIPLIDLRWSGLLFTLRRTIKGDERILSTVHSTVHSSSICPTPDTFHSDSASCSAHAAAPSQNLKLKKKGNSSSQNASFSSHNKQEFSLICPTDMHVLTFCTETHPNGWNSHDPGQPNF